MKLAVLFSGGKDSCLACYKAMEKNSVVCLVSIVSANRESYMFHTPNILFAKVQAYAMGLPIVVEHTKGEKELELEDLKRAVTRAVHEHGVEGVVTGTIASVYQSSRIQEVCDNLGLWCFNPLWQKNPLKLLKEFLSLGFRCVVSGVFAYPFGVDWLGRELDQGVVEELGRICAKYGVHPAGEGGEIETFVYDGPIFRRRIVILKGSRFYSPSEYSGVYNIEKVKLAGK